MKQAGGRLSLSCLTPLEGSAPYMQRLFTALYAATILLGLGAQAAVSIPRQIRPVEWVEGEVIVKRKGQEPQLLRLKSGVGVRSAVAAQNALEDVEYAEPNYIVRAAVSPNDPGYNRQWHLSKISAESAWETSTGSSGVRVCVVDTGIDYTHPDLAANFQEGTGYSNGFETGIVADDQGHGTHCSGIAGAVGNNGVGVSGASWRVRLLACKFMNKKGEGTTLDATRCVSWCASRGADVISASWGGGGPSTTLQSAIQSSGALFVAAAGNGGDDGQGDAFPEYPGAYGATMSNVIAVAATEEDDSLASFSNFNGDSVHVAAPGVNIYSTYAGGFYSALSGTSMATPLVAGSAALALAAAGGSGSISSSDLKEQLIAAADPVAALRGRVRSNGRLNLNMLVNGGGSGPLPPSPDPPPESPDPEDPPEDIGFMSIGLYWVQIQGDDCAAACDAAGRTALNGGNNKAGFMACAFSEDGDWWWPGTMAAEPNSCYGAYQDWMGWSFYTFETSSDYICGCIEGKASWTKGKLGACKGSPEYKQVLCRVKLRSDTSRLWFGWMGFYEGRNVCFVNYDGDTAYSKKYDRLCTSLPDDSTSKFGRAAAAASRRGRKEGKALKDISHLAAPY